jgi:hypothetical protein
MQKLLLAATVLGALAGPASADFILTPAQEGQSGIVSYNGIVNNTVVPGLSAQITYTLIDVNLATNTWLFGYALDNTSSGGISSRVSTFGFNTDPDLVSAQIVSGTVFTGVSSGNVPMLGNVDFCATAGPNCAGGSGVGVLPGDGVVSGTFQLDFAGSATLSTAIAFTDLYVRYQSITGTTLGDSGIGVPGPGVTPFCTTPPCSFAVPGPMVGAGWPGLVAAGGVLVALVRRRRKRTA